MHLKKYLLCFLTFFIAASLFPRAQPDIQLTEVDSLIEERRINEALALVEQYMRENPDDFDNAQARVDIIFKARNDYKEKADELVRIIVEDPLNDKLKLDIIDELENMEANPNEEERAFIAKIKVTSQFTYFRALYEQILQDATTLLNNGEYVESITRLTDGFVLYYDDFFESGFDPALVTQTVDNLAQANTSYSQYAQIQPDLLSVFDEFNGSLAALDITTSLSLYETVTDALDDFSQIRNTSALIGYYFEEQTALLQEISPELTDAFFLPFAYRLLLGRGNESEADIVKVMDTQWNTLYEETKRNLATLLEYYVSSLNQNVSDQTIEQMLVNEGSLNNQITQLNSVIAMGGDFLSQYELLNNSQTTFETNPHIEYQNLLDYSSYLVAQTTTLLEYSSLFENETQSIANYTEPASPDVDIRNRNTTYSRFLVVSSENSEANAQSALELVSQIQNEDASFAADSLQFTETETILSPTLSAFTQTLQSQFQTLSSQNYDIALTAWETMASFLEEGSNIIQSSYETPYTQAIPAINESLDATVQSDPATSLEDLESIMATITPDIAALQAEYDFLGITPENTSIGVQTSSAYALNQANILEDIAYLQAIQLEAQDYITLASQRVRLAQQAENEGDLRLSQAQEFLDQQNFAASRDSLQRARTQYNEALSYQYSEDLQTTSDEELAALGAEISFIENEIVVQNVRNFITQSRDNYYNSNFAQAESLILQAEAQWATTNVQENPEIITLKALIGNALSITTGRTIPSTDPLYPEMSQTLNVAYQHFDNAENLLDRNNREQALDQLDLARNKIRDVQVLYPFHQEASLLALQIDQLIDPVAFEEQFEQKFEQAQEDYIDPDTSARAYIDLLDLFEINPDYPGLEDFIYIVELELGIILPPPDLQAIARSNTLTQNAENIYDSGARDEISLNNALALLNEAIDLNAENQDALVLLDRINTSLGGAAVIVLSSQAENLYQQAVQELANGNTITAAALMTQLLQLPGVQNSSKIIDLQRRVEALL